MEVIDIYNLFPFFRTKLKEFFMKKRNTNKCVVHISADYAPMVGEDEYRILAGRVKFVADEEIKDFHFSIREH